MIIVEPIVSSFPSPERLRPFKAGLKSTFIPSPMASTTDFDEIPFPDGKGQVRERIIWFPLPALSHADGVIEG